MKGNYAFSCGKKDKFRALTVTVQALMWNKSSINAKPDGLNTSVT